ncbi:Arm DNA-binding domain-containing protein, partial [Alistipes ihumii]|uniref:Arm DNA-binding domain-containing protein n=1 Tax=Alistipes ihumii TaxID=1470347 RepID=UPI003C6D0E2B
MPQGQNIQKRHRASIHIRFTLNRQTRYVSTGFSFAPDDWDLAQQRVKTSLLNHKEIQCLTHSASSLRTSTHLPAESGRTSFSVEYDHGAQREMVRGMIPPVRVGQQAAGQYPHAAVHEQIV